MDIYEQDYIEQGARAAWALNQENGGPEWARLQVIAFRERIGKDVSKLKLPLKQSAKRWTLVQWVRSKIVKHDKR